MFGGDFTRIKIKGYLKNITEKEINTFENNAIKSKSKISYIIDNNKYTLNYSNNSKVILKRDNNEYICNMIFQINKNNMINYYSKDNDIYLDVEMKTININITDKCIKIKYLIIDSDTEYEYYVEMSD